MKVKSIINKIKGKHHAMHSHISEVTGQSSYDDPSYYENTETGEFYCHIAGAIGFPGKEQKGMLLVMGVERTFNEKPSFYALEEFEFTSIDRLLGSIPGIRRKWGYPNCLSAWYSDYERFMSILNDYNLSDADKKREQIIISTPYDLERTNNFEIYYRQIDSCLAPGVDGNKRLFLRKCNKTRNYLQNLPPDVAIKGNIETYPIVFAVGSLIHTLSIIKPWKRNVNAKSRSHEDYAKYHHLRTMKGLQRGLIPTIKE